MQKKRRSKEIRDMTSPGRVSGLFRSGRPRPVGCRSVADAEQPLISGSYTAVAFTSNLMTVSIRVRSARVYRQRVMGEGLVPLQRGSSPLLQS